MTRRLLLAAPLLGLAFLSAPRATAGPLVCVDVYVNYVIGFGVCDPSGLGAEDPIACPSVDEPVTSNSAWLCVSQLPPIG